VFDTYVRRARFYPAVIAAAPAFTLAAAIVPWSSLGLPQLIAASASLVLIAVMSHVARRRGREVEPDLIRRMGGLPTTAMLRHRDASIDEATKAAIHRFIGGEIAADVPTPETEQANPAAADNFYKRCGDWLREKSRDTKKFNIPFEENITYGFRRNLLGLRWPALALDVAVVAVCLATLWWRFSFDVGDPQSQRLLAVIVITVLQAAYVLLFVNKAGVMEAARTYGRQLLLCAQTLATPSFGKSSAPTPKPRAKQTARGASS
jgi:hypothetical protein